MSAILSIVVPFCNVEHYLDECLESIATQTLSDIEVFLVDDGSTDNSAVIAKARVARDSRFQLIQQENRGPGLARNAGLDRVAGRYLTFADGDDIVPGPAPTRRWSGPWRARAPTSPAVPCAACRRARRCPRGCTTRPCLLRYGARTCATTLNCCATARCGTRCTGARSGSPGASASPPASTRTSRSPWPPTCTRRRSTSSTTSSTCGAGATAESCPRHRTARSSATCGPVSTRWRSCGRSWPPTCPNSCPGSTRRYSRRT
ncbi:glycosyltransferase family 2 protein [Nonomuraea dietziae]|uniref:glycosyltransferase family 2 protein n=1 Tax=Nonomuraea dietziae TaxID=65515 RepID=UPI003CD094CD